MNARLHPALVGMVAALDAALAFGICFALNLRGCGQADAQSMVVIDLLLVVVFTAGLSLIVPGVAAGLIARRNPAARSAIFWTGVTVALTLLMVLVDATTPTFGTGAGAWACRLDL